jgi:two-component system, NarL family, response regulator NreC
MITIILADDHQVVRKGLQALLSAEPDFNIIGEASDGLETVKVVENLKPDILVLDLMMSGINGLEVTRQFPGECLKPALLYYRCTTTRLTYWRRYVRGPGLTF